jgi:hypothetical protein
MTSGEADPPSGVSSDERDTGWGGREWASDESGEEDPDLERLRADRPPHHEDRDR